MYNLAGLYINGIGVDKYLLKGSTLYKGSCDKDFQEGCSNVKEIRSCRIYLAGSTKLASKPDSITMHQRLIANSLKAELMTPSSGKVTMLYSKPIITKSTVHSCQMIILRKIIWLLHLYAPKTSRSFFKTLNIRKALIFLL